MLRLIRSGPPEPPDSGKIRLAALLSLKYGAAAEADQVLAHGAPLEQELASLRRQGIGKREAKRMLAEHNAGLRRSHGRH